MPKKLRYNSLEDVYEGGTPFKITVTKKRRNVKKPYKWVSARTKQLQPSELMAPFNLIGEAINEIPIVGQAFNEYVAPALSLGNYIAGKGNPYKGAQLRAEDENLLGAFLPLDFIGPKAITKATKATKPIITNMANKAKPDNIRFIRNIGTVPEVDNTGMFYLSPENQALANMTWDKSFRTHRHYKSRPGTEYLIINPRSLNGKRFLSIDPMDTYLPNTKIPAREVTLISGNPEMRILAKNRGFNVATSPEIDKAYAQLKQLSNYENSSGNYVIDLNSRYAKSPLRGSQEIIDYDNAVNSYIHQVFGKPSVLDALRLSFNTRLNPHIYPKFKLSYNKTPKIEAEMMDKYGSYPHPSKIDLPDAIIQQMFDDLKSKPLNYKTGGIYKRSLENNGKKD